MESKQITYEQYVELLHALEKHNRDYCSLMDGDACDFGEHFVRLKNAVLKGDIQAIRKMISGYMVRKPIARLGQRNQHIDPTFEDDGSEYLSSDRIAVYTSVYGNYDQILEPYIKPGNIDYFIYTESNVSDISMWKKKDACQYLQEDWTNAQKNRFIKMHPHLLFPEYNYSIYVDGNIQIVSDLTPMVNRIRECGIAAHYHSMRDCVYDELTACILYKKLKKSEVEKYRTYLKEKKMPAHYGLLMCNVLARHHNDICNEVMEEWWQEYDLRVKRDQVSLPYVLYKRSIEVKEVAVLGDSVFENQLLRVGKHL